MTNGAKLGDVITPADSDFITLNVAAMGIDFHKAWRNADGSPKPSGFAETASNSAYKSIGYHMNGGVSQAATPDPYAAGTTPVETTTITTTTTTTTTTLPVASGIAGDANDDGGVDMADVVIIMQSLANPNKYQLTAAARINADVNNRGNGITTSDALSIQRYLLGIVPVLPES